MTPCIVFCKSINTDSCNMSGLIGVYLIVKYAGSMSEIIHVHEQKSTCCVISFYSTTDTPIYESYLLSDSPTVGTPIIGIFSSFFVRFYSNLLQYLGQKGHIFW